MSKSKNKCFQKDGPTTQLRVGLSSQLSAVFLRHCLEKNIQYGPSTEHTGSLGGRHASLPHSVRTMYRQEGEGHGHLGLQLNGF